MDDEKQTENKRTDGRFAEGNKLGNRFAPGQSGNVNGRPRDGLLTKEMRQQLDAVRDDGKTNAQAIVETLIARAIRGDVKAATAILDRIEGKPTQSIVADVGFSDWREVAERYGFTEEQVKDEAKRVLESGD